VQPSACAIGVSELSAKLQAAFRVGAALKGRAQAFEDTPGLSRFTTNGPLRCPPCPNWQGWAGALCDAYHLDACPPDHYISADKGGVCEPCPPGSHRPGPSAATACICTDSGQVRLPQTVKSQFTVWLTPQPRGAEHPAFLNKGHAGTRKGGQIAGPAIDTIGCPLFLHVNPSPAACLQAWLMDPPGCTKQARGRCSPNAQYIGGACKVGMGVSLAAGVGVEIGGPHRHAACGGLRPANGMYASSCSHTPADTLLLIVPPGSATRGSGASMASGVRLAPRIWLPSPRPAPKPVVRAAGGAGGMMEGF
jgi:hypothetical protein